MNQKESFEEVDHDGVVANMRKNDEGLRSDPELWTRAVLEKTVLQNSMSTFHSQSYSLELEFVIFPPDHPFDGNITCPENGGSYQAIVADWLSKAEEEVNTVDTNLSLATWFGPKEVDTTLQLASTNASRSGLPQREGQCECGENGGGKKYNIRTASDSGDLACQAKAGMAQTQILSKRPRKEMSVMEDSIILFPGATGKKASIGSGRTLSLGVHQPALAEKLDSDPESPKIGPVTYCPRLRGNLTQAAPRIRTLADHAQDIAIRSRAAQGKLALNKWMEEKLDLDLEYQIEHVIQDNVQIGPLTQVERLWFDRIRREARLQHGNGYRIMVSQVRHDRPARTSIRHACDHEERSDVTTDAVPASAPFYNHAEDEEMESPLKPEGAN